ncbi:MAG: hypothetical protein GSR78_00400, partial [Desulfurococcales archaeon]|nr:hypothetical protein [Desulfurococcales archaeon]
RECVSAWRARLEGLVSSAASGLGLEPPLECPLCGALFATARDAGWHLQAHLDGFLDGRRGSGARAGRRGPWGVAARPGVGGGLR